MKLFVGTGDFKLLEIRVAVEEFLVIGIPSYSTQTFELFRRSGRRRTCAFQLPIRKSKSCEPSRCGRLAGFAVFWANEGAAGIAAIISSKITLNLAFMVFSLEWACQIGWLDAQCRAALVITIAYPDNTVHVFRA